MQKALVLQKLKRCDTVFARVLRGSLQITITLLRVIPTYRETTGGRLGLKLAAIHRGDDWRETGARAGGYMLGTSEVPADVRRRDE